MYSHPHHFISLKTHFSTIAHSAFPNYTHLWCCLVLPKRSTSVDQNFRSDKTYSQLSVAIFIAPRTHLGAQKSFICEKSRKKVGTRVDLALGLHFAAIYIH